MKWKRHTLVDISDSGRRAILSKLAGDTPSNLERLADVLLPERAGARVPGIIRREELYPRQGCIAVGFCGRAPDENGRLRLAAFADLQDIVRVTSPYELLSIALPQRTPATRALKAARDEAGELGLDLGVWGSVALELYTGLPYTHNESDLDLLVTAAPAKTLGRFLDAIRNLEMCCKLRIDVEIELPEGYGVQLKELLGNSRTVIAKSVDGVELLQREQIVAELPHQ